MGWAASNRLTRPLPQFLSTGEVGELGHEVLQLVVCQINLEVNAAAVVAYCHDSVKLGGQSPGGAFKLKCHVNLHSAGGNAFSCVCLRQRAGNGVCIARTKPPVPSLTPPK